MSIYVYISPRCNEEIKTHGKKEEVESFAKKIEREQNVMLLETHKGHYFKKCFGGNLRLIIEEKIVNDNIVYCFSRFLVRSDKEYDIFLDDVEKFREKNAVSDEEIEEYLRSKSNEYLDCIVQDLSDNEQECLNATFNRDIDDVLVLESVEWVKRSTEKWFEAHKYAVQKFLDHIVGRTGSPDVHETCYEFDNTIIILKFFPAYKKLFLVAPVVTAILKSPEIDGVKCSEYAGVTDRLITGHWGGRTSSVLPRLPALPCGRQ